MTTAGPLPLTFPAHAFRPFAKALPALVPATEAAAELPSPLTPHGIGWKLRAVTPAQTGVMMHWFHGETETCVTSTTDAYDDEADGDLSWHIAVGAPGDQAPSEEQVTLALCAFDMLGGPTELVDDSLVKRHFVLAVDPARRGLAANDT